MGFRFQRRINLGNGVGLNLSKSGIGASARGRHGSIGSSGFSIRTGIPGLSFRQSWGKRGDGAAVALILGLLALAAMMIVAVVQVLVWLIPVLVKSGRWCYLTARDYITFLRTGSQPDGDVEPCEIAQPQFDPTEKTLAEILADPGPSLQPAVSSFSSVARPPVAPPPRTPGVVLHNPNSGGSGAAIAGAVALGLALVLGMCRWSGDTKEPQFDADDLAAWRTVMLDAKQPASVRLSNAQVIIQRFPGTVDATYASSLRTQLSEASVAESVERNAEALAKAAERQALIDRKERREPALPSGREPNTQAVNALAAGLAGAALVSKGSARTPSSPSLNRAPSESVTKPSAAERSTEGIRDGSVCPCSGSFDCTGPRGGRYCVTSGGNKRYRGKAVARSDSSCPCSGGTNCVGPRGGSFCITSGGNKRYR